MNVQLFALLKSESTILAFYTTLLEFKIDAFVLEWLPTIGTDCESFKVNLTKLTFLSKTQKLVGHL